MAEVLGSLRDQLLLRELDLHKLNLCEETSNQHSLSRPKVRFEQNAPPDIESRPSTIHLQLYIRYLSPPTYSDLYTLSLPPKAIKLPSQKYSVVCLQSKVS
jgi:hypothetical protein